MKKNYFSILFAALMLFVAMPAKAQVSAMSDLFGKWKFTATITTTEAGAAHASKFKNDCEVTIGAAESQYFMADIKGFAGADYGMSVSDFSASKSSFEVFSPNQANYGIWEGYIAVANADGQWPFALQEKDEETGQWVDIVKDQFSMSFPFDPETKEVTIADFTIVSLDWGTHKATILANVTNAKLTPVELEVKDTSAYPDLTGLWTWEGGLRTDTVSLKGFTVAFEMKDSKKDSWKATFSFGDYEPFTLDATFDGEVITIPHDTTYLDKEAGIRFGTRGSATEGKSEFMFSYNSKTSMSLYNYIYVRKDVYSGDTLKGGKIYQVFDGYITRENPDAFDWSGVYSVEVRNAIDRDKNDTITLPAKFDMVVEKKPGSLYEVTEFLGYKDLYFSFEPGDDDKSASINLGGYSGAMLESLGEIGEGDDTDYAYRVVTDANAKPTSLKITMNEDGTFSFEDFSVSYKLYYAGTYEAIYAFVGAKATKKVFDWAGEYTLTADVEEMDTVKCASEFDVKIEQIEGAYYITKFDGDQVYSLNYGGIEVKTINRNNAEFTSGCFIKGAFPIYTTLDSEDNSTIKLTMDNTGNITMSDFFYTPYNYETYESGKPFAKYTNVVLTKKADDSAVDSIFAEKPVVEGIFDMMGRKLDAITAPGLYIVNGKKVLVK